MAAAVYIAAPRLNRRDSLLSRRDENQPNTNIHVNIDTGGDLTDPLRPIILSGDATTFIVDFLDAATDEPFFKQALNGPWEPDAATYETDVTIEFSDANGGVWQRSNTRVRRHTGWKLA
jgi:hypothetical protein